MHHQINSSLAHNNNCILNKQNTIINNYNEWMFCFSLFPSFIQKGNFLLPGADVYSTQWKIKDMKNEEKEKFHYFMSQYDVIQKDCLLFPFYFYFFVDSNSSIFFCVLFLIFFTRFMINLIQITKDHRVMFFKILT